MNNRWRKRLKLLQSRIRRIKIPHSDSPSLLMRNYGMKWSLWFQAGMIAGERGKNTESFTRLREDISKLEDRSRYERV